MPAPYLYHEPIQPFSTQKSITIIHYIHKQILLQYQIGTQLNMNNVIL